MKLAALLRDAAGIVGCGFVAAGAWMVYHPAGLIAGGLMLLAGVLFTARKGG